MDSLKKTIMRYSCCCMLIMISCAMPLAYAVTDADKAQQANQLYEKAQYTDAITLYQEALTEGAYNGHIFYNLGNAYFKAGHLGRAILNYKRAERLLPRDPDIRANLDFVQTLIIDRITVPEQGFFIQRLIDMHNAITLNEFTVAFMIVMALFFLQLSMMLYMKKHRRMIMRMLVITGCMLLIVISALSVKIYQYNRTEAVVIVEHVEVTSGPADHYGVQFSAHEGTVFSVLQERNGWCEVQLSGQLRGWVQKDAIAYL